MSHTSPAHNPAAMRMMISVLAVLRCITSMFLCFWISNAISWNKGEKRASPPHKLVEHALLIDAGNGLLAVEGLTNESHDRKRIVIDLDDLSRSDVSNDLVIGHPEE